MEPSVFIVVVDYDRDVSYGVDSQTYICGVYAEEEQAKIRKKQLEDGIEKCKKILSAQPWPDEDAYDKAEEELGFSIKPLIRPNWDCEWSADVYIQEFVYGDDCLECISSVSYAE